MAPPWALDALLPERTAGRARAVPPSREKGSKTLSRDSPVKMPGVVLIADRTTPSPDRLDSDVRWGCRPAPPWRFYEEVARLLELPVDRLCVKRAAPGFNVYNPALRTAAVD